MLGNQLKSIKIFFEIWRAFPSTRMELVEQKNTDRLQTIMKTEPNVTLSDPFKFWNSKRSFLA
jgi:hypothetical protein